MVFAFASGNTRYIFKLNYGVMLSFQASEYDVPADFHRDMLLVKSNCCKYNPPGHIVRKVGIMFCFSMFSVAIQVIILNL